MSNGATSGYSTFHYPPSTDLLIPLWTDISFTVFFVDSLTSLVRSIYDQDASTATSITAPQQTPLPDAPTLTVSPVSIRQGKLQSVRGLDCLRIWTN